MKPEANPFLLTEADEKKVARKQFDFRDGLKIPRRPAWTTDMTRLQLEKQERESFLDWRRELARLAEDSSLLLTPFERNIQLWRQLWRVIERSHLVVQIVDARNPLGFRSADLEDYVKEVGSEEGDEAVPGKGKRRSLLLINKADLLTYDQRLAWAEYFEAERIEYAFFSAADAAAALEQAEKQRQRALGIYESGDEASDDEASDSEGSDEEDAESDEDEDEEEIEEEDELDETDEDELDSEDDEDEETEEKPEQLTAQDKGKQRATVEDVDEVAEAAEALQQVQLNQPPVDEDMRTRVLTIGELEDLFISSAPPLSEFASSRDPNPSKLMIGLVGYPNVGKSSTINALIGSKKVSVSATPGKTKHFQTLVLSDKITLCDCPGLVFPQFANTQADMICDGVLPIDQMREYSAPVDLVCRRIPREILEGTYGIRIDVKEVEDGGTGKVGWEDLLSAYAIARGMTRASFGMPDTSRAARYVLKDYVNAKLLYGRAPPGMDADAYMSTSRAQTLQEIEDSYAAGRKRAPETHVSKNSDTYVAPASSKPAISTMEPIEEQGPAPTHRQISQNSATAAGRTGRAKAAALEDHFFSEPGAQPRVVVKGRTQGDAPEMDFSRPNLYPHQRRLGPDGMPILETGVKVRNNGKKHFKEKRGKQRSGRGYD